MLFAPFVTRCNSANGVQRLRLMSDSRNLVRRQYSNKNLEKIQRIFSKIFAYLENLGVQHFNFVIFILKLQVLVSHFNDLKFTISTTKVLQVALSAQSELPIFCHLVSKQRDDAPQWIESTKSSSIYIFAINIEKKFDLRNPDLRKKRDSRQFVSSNKQNY